MAQEQFKSSPLKNVTVQLLEPAATDMPSDTQGGAQSAPEPATGFPPAMVDGGASGSLTGSGADTQVQFDFMTFGRQYRAIVQITQHSGYRIQLYRYHTGGWQPSGSNLKSGILGALIAQDLLKALNETVPKENNQ